MVNARICESARMAFFCARPAIDFDFANCQTETSNALNANSRPSVAFEQAKGSGWVDSNVSLFKG